MDGIDIGTIAQAMSSLGSVVSAIRQLIESLPPGEEKDKAVRELQAAERQLKLAEGQAAQRLRYELCRNHYPPEVMLSADDTVWRCPKCGNTRGTGPAIGFIPGPDFGGGLFR